MPVSQRENRVMEHSSDEAHISIKMKSRKEVHPVKYNIKIICHTKRQPETAIEAAKRSENLGIAN
jgi:hypothetical protein